MSLSIFLKPSTDHQDEWIPITVSALPPIGTIISLHPTGGGATLSFRVLGYKYALLSHKNGDKAGIVGFNDSIFANVQAIEPQ